LGLAALRSVLVVHAFAVLTQSVFAGQFLAGADSSVRFHEINGWLILALSATQVGLAAFLLRSGAVSLWLMFGSVFIFLGEGLQIGTGYGRFLNVHIPLGVIVFGALSWQAVALFLRREPSGTKS
jgi:hypothetical protein